MSSEQLPNENQPLENEGNGLPEEDNEEEVGESLVEKDVIEGGNTDVKDAEEEEAADLKETVGEEIDAEEAEQDENLDVVEEKQVNQSYQPMKEANQGDTEEDGDEQAGSEGESFGEQQDEEEEENSEEQLDDESYGEQILGEDNESEQPVGDEDDEFEFEQQLDEGGLPDMEDEEPEEYELENEEFDLGQYETGAEESNGESMKYPKSVDSLYQLIEPDREEEFNKQVDQLNQHIKDIQHEICLERKQRLRAKVKKFEFEKDIIKESISESGILYLPGNFLQPIIGRRINDKDLPFIFECIQDFPTLKGFNFAYNEITDEGLEKLCEFIQDRESVIHLNISHNDFTAKGVETLVGCLIYRPSLHSLKITGVKVGDEGMNAITCLYMCGKGPLDLDVSETDMTMSGFQALCTSFQAVDENDDHPKLLTKHTLPYTLDTLAHLKVENHNAMKVEAMAHICTSHFELLPTSTKAHPADLTSIIGLPTKKEEAVKPENRKVQSDAFTDALEDLFTASLGLGDEDTPKLVDLSQEANASAQYKSEPEGYSEMDAFIHEHRMIREAGCKSGRSDARPVIVCPSLYSLDIDDFVDDAETELKNQAVTVQRRVNPLYMDSLVMPVVEEEARDVEKEVADSLTTQKASVRFVRETIKEAGALAGLTEYTHDSDKTQVLLITILETAKRFLEAEIDGGDLTEAELQTIWTHSLETSMKIFRPAIPEHCTITEGTLKLFVEQFMKISNRTFFRLLQNPFLYELFEEAATKGCIEATTAIHTYDPPSTPMSSECVRQVVLRFLEEIILRAGEIVGGGDPYDLRGKSVRESHDTFLQDAWPDITNMTEDMVEPLVEKFFKAGALLAEDSVAYREESKTNQDGGIEPAQMFLEGIFDELLSFLHNLKKDDQITEQRINNLEKGLCLATKPVRIVLNRPFFNGCEPIMASKLAAYLRGNESLRCIHLRKWDLGEDGLINLMDGLIANVNIVTLDLASNGIGAEGMRPLGEYIKKSEKLRHLLLNNNRLRNPGFKFLTAAITESNLVSINVAFNDVTEVGLNPFLEAIKRTRIRSLYILGNCFTKTSWSLLNDLFESRQLIPEDCDCLLQEIDGEGVIVRNSQARDTNEWYEVPAEVEVGLSVPPYLNEHYKPHKMTLFGTDVDYNM